MIMTVMNVILLFWSSFTKMAFVCSQWLVMWSYIVTNSNNKQSFVRRIWYLADLFLELLFPSNSPTFSG